MLSPQFFQDAVGALDHLADQDILLLQRTFEFNGHLPNRPFHS